MVKYLIMIKNIVTHDVAVLSAETK